MTVPNRPFLKNNNNLERGNLKNDNSGNETLHNLKLEYNNKHAGAQRWSNISGSMQRKIIYILVVQVLPLDDVWVGAH